MMKNIKYLGIPLVVFVIAIAATTILSKAARINFDSVMSSILSKIPILDNLIETDYNTGLYGLSQMDMAEMRSAVYNVDFLMSISAPDFNGGLTQDYVRQYLAIYPYIVEAGINLNNVKSSSSDGITTINLPSPQIKFADLDANRGISVIRNTEIPPELINMMKKTFEKRAVDLAYNSGIITTAKEKAEEYFSNLFPKEKFEFIFADPPSLYDSVVSNKSPIKFVYRKEALERINTFSVRHRKIQTDESKVYFNPVDMFLKTKDGKEFNLYYQFDTKLTVSEFNKEATYWVTKQAQKKKECFFVKYYDSQYPESKRIATINWGESNSPIYFTVGNSQYNLGTKEKINGNELYKVYGDLMYLATCSSEQDLFNPDYDEYLRTYDGVTKDIEQEKYDLANSKLSKIKALKEKNGEGLNYAEKDLQSIISLYAHNKYDTTGYDKLDTLLKVAYIFKQQDNSLLTKDFQEMIISQYDLFGLTENDLNYMIEYFYNLPITTESDRKEYRKILINRGYYNDKIFNSLSGTEFCKYLINIMKSYDNDILIQENRISETTIVGQKKVIRDDNYSQIKIEDFLKKNNLLSNNGVVIWCFKPDGLLIQDYPLILFYKDKVTYIPDFKAILGPKFYNDEYTHIDTHKLSYNVSEITGEESETDSQISFYKITIGGKEHNDQVLYNTIREIKDRKQKYSKKNHWINSIDNKIASEIMNYCKREKGIF